MSDTGRGAYCISPSTKSFGNAGRPHPHSEARHTPAVRRCRETFSAKQSCGYRILRPVQSLTIPFFCKRGMPHAGTTLDASSHTKPTSFPRSRVLPVTLDPGAGRTRMSPVYGSHNCHALYFGRYPEESDLRPGRRPPSPVPHRGRGCRAPRPWNRRKWKTHIMSPTWSR